MVDVVVIGGGNVAWSLLERIRSCSALNLVGCVVRRADIAEQISCHFEVEVVGSVEQLPQAQLYILAVSDSAIAELSEEVEFASGAVVAHTAGSVPITALSSKIEHRGVIYPMQTFTKGRSVDWSEVSIFIEGATECAEQMVHRVASELSSRVYSLTSQQRISLHIAAVFGCNFTNALWGIATKQLEGVGMSLSTLKPLLEETLRKAVESGDPVRVQTGPAVRGDMVTQQNHLEMIESEEQQEIYKLLSSMIWKTSRRN